MGNVALGVMSEYNSCFVFIVNEKKKNYVKFEKHTKLFKLFSQMSFEDISIVY